MASVDFEYKMEYEPEKRLSELKRIITGFVRYFSDHTPLKIECQDIEWSSEEILLLYNYIIHRESKSFMDEDNRYLSRSKIISATQFAVMQILPLKFSENKISNSISIEKLNAHLCWVIYVAFVLDFPSHYDIIKTGKRNFRNGDDFESHKNDFIKWLTIKNPRSYPILITSYFLELLTNKYLISEEIS